ncbi:MAG: CapA family protein [Lentisphaeria bacterium]|nr:CapA family protein [Lentisphaeria bacterium]
MFAENGKLRIRPVMGNQVKIVVAGDTCPHGSAEDDLLGGNTSRLLAGIKPALEDADLRIIQWETVISDTPDPTLKCGPNLIVSPGCESFITEGGFEIALLANNHTGDHGGAGVMSTMKILKDKGVMTVGAGMNAEEAAKPLRFEKNGLKFSIINVCEMEFGTAKADQPGANAMKEYKVPVQIAEEKRISDIVIVVIHGGNEFNPVPSPRMKDLYRSFAAAGAHLVMNIHTHCPQGIELFGGVPIVYCPGNFFFSDMGEFNPASFWWSGYLPKFTFDSRGVAEIEITPYVFSPAPWKIEALTGAQRQWYLEYIDRISAAIDAEGDHLFDIWCAFKYQMPISWIHNAPAEILLNDITSEEGLKRLPVIRHLFTCQSHNELARNVFLLTEQKRISELVKEIPYLTELRTARFAEQAK